MIRAEATVVNEKQVRCTVEINGDVEQLAIQLNAIIKELASSELGEVVIHSVFANNFSWIINSTKVFLKHEDKIKDLMRRLSEIDKNNTCN